MSGVPLSLPLLKLFTFLCLNANAIMAFVAQTTFVVAILAMALLHAKNCAVQTASAVPTELVLFLPENAYAILGIVVRIASFWEPRKWTKRVSVENRITYPTVQAYVLTIAHTFVLRLAAAMRVMVLSVPQQIAARHVPSLNIRHFGITPVLIAQNILPHQAILQHREMRVCASKDITVMQLLVIAQSVSIAHTRMLLEMQKIAQLATVIQ